MISVFNLLTLFDVNRYNLNARIVICQNEIYRSKRDQTEINHNFLKILESRQIGRTTFKLGLERAVMNDIVHIFTDGLSSTKPRMTN